MLRVWQAVPPEGKVFKATRVAFGESLVAIGESHENVVVLDADLGSSVQTRKFGEAYPDRFIELGIAEGNMIGVAAGLALSGKKVFAASFACFIAGRFEQIRMSIGYNNANVCVVGTHAGVGIGEDGYSQMGLEDIALMRSLPNMVVIQPGDAVEAARATEFLADYAGPAYLRLTRQGLAEYNDESYSFEFGEGVELRRGADLTLVASGGVVGHAVEAAERLAGRGFDVGVINIHTIKPVDASLLVATAGRCARIMTVEDHGVVGGLGDAVLEALAELPAVSVRKHGVHGYGESGSGAELYRKHRLDADGIAEIAREFIADSAEPRARAAG